VLLSGHNYISGNIMDENVSIWERYLVNSDPEAPVIAKRVMDMPGDTEENIANMLFALLNVRDQLS